MLPDRALLLGRRPHRLAAPAGAPRHARRAPTAFDRSVVIHPDESVRIRVLDRSAPLLMEADGRLAGKLRPLDAIVARVAGHPARLVRMDHSTFYARARRKLQLPASLPE